MSPPEARSVVGDLTADYRTTLLRFLPRRDEAARASAYELGRRAFSQGVSLLDVCRVHHEVVLDVLRETKADELLDVTEKAAELLLEVLASYDMTHRVVLEQ
ncbi:phosphatase RsbU N-terminal domain-containing protein [Humibacillus xanthopallidus]|uniref:phosphatase RsbU N-terminal domain-containing protein n=1 Tax=Humibacillus xanthopallidus TaxID=412689 RepID=UPI00384BCB82